MARRLILDTGFLIAQERGSLLAKNFLQPPDDIAISAITVAELYAGIELASLEKRAARAAFAERLLKAIFVIPFDMSIAKIHSKLFADCYRQGRKRGNHDLIIAATAASTGRTLVTTDQRANFTQLPGVSCIIVH